MPTNLDIDKHLGLVRLNIRSIQKHIKDLCDFISNLSTKPHVICISETKIKHSPNSNVVISGYFLLYQNSLTNASGAENYLTIHCIVRKNYVKPILTIW